MTRGKTASSQLEWARGSTRPPVDPTGRLVGAPRQNKGRDEVSHWCPDAIKSGVTSWRCPRCGAEFEWRPDSHRWVRVDGP